MNKTIYIRDEDAHIWDRAKELAKEALSPVIVEALKRFVAVEEAKMKGFERLEVKFDDSEAANVPRRKAFFGHWIYSPEDPLKSADEDQPITDCEALAITAKGNIVTFTWRLDNTHPDYQYAREYKFKVFPSFEAAAADPQVNYLVCKAMEKIGVPVDELDI